MTDTERTSGDPVTGAGDASEIPVGAVVRLVRAMQEFDPSDDYHDPDQPDPGYYAAIHRCIALVQGDITDWTSPPPRDEPCRYCGHGPETHVGPYCGQPPAKGEDGGPDD